MIARIKDACDASCHSMPCADEYTRTKTSFSRLGKMHLGFALMSPQEPDVETSVQPTMSFIEFFSFVCSCFGTWFGLSFLSLESLLRRRHRMRMKVGRDGVAPVAQRSQQLDQQSFAHARECMQRHAARYFGK